MTEMHDYFDEAKPFFEGMEEADKYGLKWEYTAALFKALGVTQQQVFEASIHAMREWDL